MAIIGGAGLTALMGLVSDHRGITSAMFVPMGSFAVVTGFAVDYTKCMFCALCIDPCPVDSIFMGSNHDISCYSRDGCIVDYARLPLDVAWGKTALNPTVISESKVIVDPVWSPAEQTVESN